MVRPDAIQHVQMATRGHLLAIGVGKDFLVSQFREFAAMLATMRKQHRLVDPQFGRSADMAVAAEQRSMPENTLTACQGCPEVEFSLVGMLSSHPS